MSNYTYFSMSHEKGLRANVGRKPVVKFTGDGHRYVDVMLFMVPNSASHNGEQASQIINAHFPESWLDKLNQLLNVGDYIRLQYEQLNFAKPSQVEGEWNDVVNFMVVKKISRIEVLRKAPPKATEAVTSTTSHPVLAETPTIETLDQTAVNDYLAASRG